MIRLSITKLGLSKSLHGSNRNHVEKPILVVDMDDMLDKGNVSRRQAIKKGAIISTVLAGGSTLTGTVAAKSGKNRGKDRGDLVSQVASHGHYSYFPDGPPTWGRSKNPFDIRQDDMRWMANPAGGGIRCHIENLPEMSRNAGFDVHLGTLGSVKEVTGSWRTVQTASGDSANLLGALYFDVDGDGEFFQWTNEQGNTDDFVNLGGDTERFLVGLSTDEFTIDDQTTVVNPFTWETSTVGAIRNGGIKGVDGSTDIALYLGVGWPEDQSSGTEELVVESLNVKRV